MAVVIDEQIFGFEVPVDNFVLMEIEESEKYLNEIEFGIGFRHPFHLLQVKEQLPPRAIYIRVDLQSKTKHTKL